MKCDTMQTQPIPVSCSGWTMIYEPDHNPAARQKLVEYVTDIARKRIEDEARRALLRQGFAGHAEGIRVDYRMHGNVKIDFFYRASGMAIPEQPIAEAA